MITLLHGDNTTASRAEYNRLRDEAKGREIRVLDAGSADATLLTQALESNSLFGGQTAIFIENILSKLGRKQKRIEEIADILRKTTSDSSVVLWEEKTIGPSVSKLLGKVTIHEFKLPKLLFQFLDAIAPSHGEAVTLYQSVIETEAPELVHYLTVSRVRQLIQIKDNVTPAGVSGWQMGRLTGQAKLFTIDKLRAMYKNLLTMEFSIKNGSSPFSLRQLTEQFLLDL